MPLSERTRELFDHALELDEPARAQFLDDACGSDQALRADVESLLAAADKSGNYFERFSAEVGLPSQEAVDSPLPANKLVGQWRLLKLIGRGGMGAVYLADRADGQFEKRAALKVLPIGLSDERSRARFLTERQILARLVHDNIARLLDGGVTEDGTPYFVMDFIDGVPIDRFCNEQKLGIRDRLLLMLHVARAVQFAHRNLVIHRDLKPGNVLVESSGHVKLLDFGIAKTLEPNDDEPQLTRHALRPVTPAFASPEMLSGAVVDVTTDVYSLGALLYLLLTGKAPLSYDGLGLVEMQTHAREFSPNAVSQLNPLASSDIDAIVSKALAKESALRYESVQSFANDIENHLDGLPVTARPPSAWYRMRKFVGRHRVAVAFGLFAAISIATIAGLAVTSAIQSDRQSQQIALALTRAERTKDFLISIFDAAGPGRDAAELTAREILLAGKQRIGEELGDQPEVQADLLGTIAGVYGSLGLSREWREALSEEVRLREQLAGSNSQEYVDALLFLAQAEEQDGEYDIALEHALQGLALQEQLDSRSGQGTAHFRLARIRHLQGDFELANSGYREALAIFESELGGDSEQAAEVKIGLATLLNHQQQYAAAQQLLSEAMGTYESLGLMDLPQRTDIYLALAESLHKLNRFDEAVAILNQAYAKNESLVGQDNSYNMFVVNALGKVAMDQGDFDLAASSFAEAGRLVELFTPQSPNLGFAMARLGETYLRSDRCDRAQPVLQRAEQLFQERLASHWHLGVVRWQLGLCLLETKDYESAEELILSGLRTIEAQWGREHEATRDALAAADRLYAAWDRPEQADHLRQNP